MTLGRPGRLLAALTSQKAAFVLIALLVLQILISALVPQKDIARHAPGGWEGLGGGAAGFLDLDRIYFSPLFYASLILLAANLVVDNVRRARLIGKTGRTPVKLRYLGSIVFHLSLVLIIGGALLNSRYKFDGVFGITEGQTLRDVPGDYHQLRQGGWRRPTAGAFTLYLEEAAPDFLVRGAPTGAATVVLTAADGSRIVGNVHVNHPLCWADVEIHYGGLMGYSPEILVADEAGRPLFRSFVRLQVHETDSGPLHRDHLPLPDLGLRVETTIDPAGDIDGEPGRLVRLLRDETELASVRLSAADTLDAEGLRITVPRVRRWCYLHVVRNPWLEVVFAGFWTGLAGLALSTVPRVLTRRERST